MKIFVKILLLFLILQIGTAFAVEEKTNIRVGISNSSFSTYEFNKASFISSGDVSAIDMSTGKKADISAYQAFDTELKDGVFNIKVNNDNVLEGAIGPVVISSADKIGIINLKRKGTPAYYSGMIELDKIKENKFNIVNVLSMQDYLKGVVPNEMPVSFGFEALKAQAVAARNYANRPNTVYKNYDVCDSTACQVYYGKNSQTSISDKAVDETEGIYAFYNNDLILALYSSTPSGITESYINTFGNGIENKPYMVSVKDNKHLKQLKDEDDILKYYKEKPASFDMNSPKYRWEVKFDRFELEDILSKTLYEQSKAGAVSPKFNKDQGFYGLEDIKIIKRGNSYKALEVEVKSVSGDYFIKKELPIRRVFKKNNKILSSANFSIEKEYKKPDKEELKEAEENNTADKNSIAAQNGVLAQNILSGAIFKSEDKNIKKDEKRGEDKGETLTQASSDSGKKRIYKTKFGRYLPSSFTFFGAGFGHGVGLSQYGAGYLSSYGVNYENILKHYYTGINLGTIKKTVAYNEADINYVQNFYFNKKTASKAALSISKSPMREELSELIKKQNDKNKCYLTIENYDRVSKVEFYINDYYFSPDVSGFNKRVLKTDITNFLSNGRNKIVFRPLTKNDKRKTVKFYLTFGDINEQQ